MTTVRSAKFKVLMFQILVLAFSALAPPCIRAVRRAV